MPVSIRRRHWYASHRTPRHASWEAAARALAGSGTPDPDGWVRAALPVESLDHAHGVFLALGEDVEVLGPPELRAAVAATVHAPAMRYASG
ncbi:WYL domain-containing protein [Streptomyces sp. NPDC056831]|uniref:WYL domain-containing protein n=1 Tax=Streptomyces sp. NPDC056831 TaxID=3345954 RepID=UPI003681A31E